MQDKDVSDLRGGDKAVCAENGSEPQDVVEREPPSDLDAERAVIGMVLVDDADIWRRLTWLKPDHFFDVRHAEIFDLIRSGSAVDLADGELREFAIKAAATPHSLDRLARRVLRLSARRLMIVIGEDLVANARDRETRVEDAVALAMDDIHVVAGELDRAR